MAPSINASCLPTANPLRFDCSVDIQPAQPVDIFFAPTIGGVEHSFGSDAVANQHDIQLAFLKAGIRYTWRAVGRDDPSQVVVGYLRAGVPTDGCGVDGSFSGSTTASYFVVNSPCAGAGMNGAIVVVDSDGDVVWCDQFLDPGAAGQVLGFSLTEDQTILATVTSSRNGVVRERDFQGNEVLVLQEGVDFPDQNHHIAYRWNGLTYVLVHETVVFSGSTFLMDAFYVFDGNTQVAEWHLADHHTPPAGYLPAGAGDYSHANSIWIDDRGVMLLSLRHQSAVLAIAADPVAPDFGDVLWVMSSSQSYMPSDFVFTSSAGQPAQFEMQHDPHFLPNGQLMLFDNCPGAPGHGSCATNVNSRVLALDVDEVAGTAHIARAHSMGTRCDFQGGAQETAAGNPVGTCAPNRFAKEFDRVTGANVWTGQLLCASGSGFHYTTRFVPWEGPW